MYKRQAYTRVRRCNEEKSLERSIARVDIRERLGVCFSSAVTSEDDGLEGKKGGKGLDSEN